DEIARGISTLHQMGYQIFLEMGIGANLIKYLGKINYTYLTPLLPLASCLLPIFTRKLSWPWEQVQPFI
ncbi:MAG: hypothetical protein ACKO7A_02515, partial [Microcystis sp.]